MSPHVAVARRGGAALIAIVIAVTTAVALLIGPAHAAIVATVPLGTSANYSVLAGSTVTNVNNPGTTLSQSLGLSPGTSVTGFPPGLVTGATDVNNAAAGQAKLDLTTAYNNAAGRPLDGFIPAGVLGGLTLQGGVYGEASLGALNLTGTLTLDGANNADTVFIIKTNSTLTTASSSVVSLIRGAQECNVFWQVGSSATLGGSSTMVGNVMADQSITVGTGASVAGRAMARIAAVTLDTNVFTTPSCATTPTPGTPTTPVPGTGTPTAGTPAATPGSGTPGSGTPGRGSGTPGTPGVPSVVAPPRTGGGPLSGETLPWPALLFFGVIGVGGTVVLARNRLARLHSAAPVDH
jgi:hypothetical protein